MQRRPDETTARTADEGKVAAVPLATALRYWLKLGFINFGGPAGQIAIMHEELVDRRRWIGDGRFAHALNFCMLLPGPEAQQLAIYIGWLLNGTLGGILAGILFILPGFFLILLLSWTYIAHGDVTWVTAIFNGLQSAVIALVLAAVIRIGSRALKNPLLVAVAALAFFLIFLVRVPFPFIVIGAAAAGFLGSKWDSRLFPPPLHDEADERVPSADAVAAAATGLRRPAVVALVGLSVWWVPLLLVMWWRGADDTLSQEAVFFSQAAMVTFGGAYAVLAYINQAAVHQFGWLQPGQMLTGLGLAESTPGPLIMVTQFVGFLAGYRFPGDLDPIVGGILGAVVAVWATFAPCFLWVLLGAPYIERLRGNRALDAALSAVTAAVVGVILNLAVTFALAALFDRVGRGSLLGLTVPVPELSSLDYFSTALAAAAFVAVWRYRVGVLWVIGGCAAAGLISLLV